MLRHLLSVCIAAFIYDWPLFSFFVGSGRRVHSTDVRLVATSCSLCYLLRNLAGPTCPFVVAETPLATILRLMLGRSLGLRHSYRQPLLRGHISSINSWSESTNYVIFRKVRVVSTDDLRAVWIFHKLLVVELWLAGGLRAYRRSPTSLYVNRWRATLAALRAQLVLLAGRWFVVSWHSIHRRSKWVVYRPFFVIHNLVCMARNYQLTFHHFGFNDRLTLLLIFRDLR